MTCMQTAYVSPMMQTVIRWRRPSEFEAPNAGRVTNPCSTLLGHSLCYVISGSLLLVVGVIITSLTFQNLDGSSSENKERYAGPVLIAAGALVMARGALSHLWPRRRTMSARRRRSLLRRYIREIYSRPIFALQHSSSFSLCDIEVSDLCHVSSRTRLYSDDPPSYEIVTSDEYHVHAYGNPAGDAHSDDHDADIPDPPIRIVITPSPEPAPSSEDTSQPPSSEVMCQAPSPEDLCEAPSPEDLCQAHPSEYPCQPPSYEDYIKSENMKTTSL